MPDLSTGHVFMSYSRRDDAVMRRIVTFLRQQGIKVWVDNEKLIPGTPVWEVEIEKAIKSAPAIVVVLSPDSKDSEWVRREISLADQYRKRVFPVMVRGDEESSISLRLIGRQYVDIRKYEEAGLNYVSVSLLRYLEELDEQEQNAKKEAARLATQKARNEKKLAKQRAEEDRIAHEKIVGQASSLTDENEKRLAAQKAEEERIVRENVEAERKAKIEADRLAAQKAEDERIVREKTEAERKANVEVERLAAQKAEEERIVRENAEAERKAKIEADRLAAQKVEDERIVRENAEAERKAKVEVERLAAQKVDESVGRFSNPTETSVPKESQAESLTYLPTAREKEYLPPTTAEIYNRSYKASYKATQALLPKLKIPALVLVVGFVVYLLWRGITSLPINSDPSLTETRSAQMQTAVQETIAAQWTSMSAAGTIAAQETSTRVAEMIVTKSAAETMVVIQTESARPIETTVPTLTLVIGSTMTSDKDNMTSLYVPKGEFTMGNGDSNAPIHNVYLDAFYIDQFEVTNEMYAKCVADNGTCAEPSDTNHFSNASYANHPVVYVDWEMAKTYCNWAGGDLPTEAQWEKAASWDEASQTQRVYPWGDSIDCNHANYQSGCVGDTSPVGSYDSGKSPYGAYEMAGNVWEWVNDYYQSDYYADNASNPQGPTSSEYRVLRGGSWLNFNFDARSAIRLRYTPDNSSDFIGFRCARSLP